MSNHEETLRLNDCLWMSLAISSLTSTSHLAVNSLQLISQCYLILISILIDFNCHRFDWGYSIANTFGTRLCAWASKSKLATSCNTQDAVSFTSRRWRGGTDSDLAFSSSEANKLMADRRVLGKYLCYRHRPSDTIASDNTK